MSKVHKTRRWLDADTLTPHDVNAHLEEYVGEMNGHLDRDNIDANLIIGDKVALDTFHNILWVDIQAPVVLTRDADNHQRWITIMSGTLLCDDGRLEIEAQAGYLEGTPATLTVSTPGIDLGIFVDGALVGRSGVAAGYDANSLTAVAAPAIGPGTKTIEAKVRIAPGHTVVAGGTFGGTILAGALWARFLGR